VINISTRTIWTREVHQLGFIQVDRVLSKDLKIYLRIFICKLRDFISDSIVDVCDVIKLSEYWWGIHLDPSHQDTFGQMARGMAGQVARGVAGQMA
jgi:hypothetical protein